MANRIIVFGATGYTGGLVVDALLRRGVRPVLAGRDQGRLSRLADQFDGLAYQIADVTDPSSIGALVNPGDVLVTTVGPFAQYGHPVAQAAVEAGAHYVDSTGEVGFVHELQRRHDTSARSAGVTMVPAFGYDYVPGILAGVLAAQTGGSAVQDVQIGYFAIGPLRNGLSHGTRKTMAEGMLLPSLVWRNHALEEEVTAHRVQRFPVREALRNAFLVSGTEVLFLPAQFRNVASVSVYNGWFPRLSRTIQLVSAIANTAARSPNGRRLVTTLSNRTVGGTGGPDRTERSRTLTHAVAVARDGRGDIVTEVHVEGPSPYTLTGELIAWAADQLASGNAKTAGVTGPTQAFGLDELINGCAEVGLTKTTQVGPQ